MSEFKGTPGPYSTRPMGDVLAPNGELLAHCYQPDASKGTKAGEDEREYTAELFAAAPELLEALQLFMDMWNSGDSVRSSKRAQARRAEMWDKANAAVAKATGTTGDRG